MNKRLNYKKKSEAFSTETYDELNATIYYKPDEKILSVKLTNTTKIKELFTSDDFKESLIYLFTYRVDIDSKRKIISYLEDNYNKPDNEIYNALYTFSFVYLPENDLIMNIGTTFEKLHLKLNKDNILTVLPVFLTQVVLNASEKFDDTQYQLITIDRCLHFIQQEQLNIIFDEITRIIKKGGLVIISEYDVNPLIRNETNILDILYAYYYNNTNLMNFNTIKYWSRYLLDRGFTIIKTEKSDDIFKITNVVFTKT